MKIFPRLAAGGAVAAAGLVLWVTSASGGASQPSEADRSAAAAPVHEVLPGSGAALATTPNGGFRLSIAAPSRELSLPGADDPAFSVTVPAVNANVISAAHLAWKAQLAAGLVASRNSAVLGFDVGLSDVVPDPDQRSYLHMSLRRRPGSRVGSGFDRLGSVPVAQVRAQLSSNLEVLTSGLPPGTVKSKRIVVIPVDPSHGLFALEADLKVTALEALTPRLGDLVSGLATGLMGNEHAVVEGLAISVADERGRRAAWWRTGRAGIGMGVPGPVFASVPVPPVDAVFPNLTDGPPTIVSVSGQQSPAG